jgi:hypothetical protein
MMYEHYNSTNEYCMNSDTIGSNNCMHTPRRLKLPSATNIAVTYSDINGRSARLAVDEI